MLHLSRVITIQDRRKRSWKEAMKLEHRTPGYKAYPQSSTVEPSWRCSVISPGENILTIRQNADRVTAVFWYSRWEGEPRSARIFTHCQSLDCQNLQKEKHIDEISYSGIRSGILLDQLFGDPYFLPHPIRGIGWLIAKTEKTLRAGNPQGNSTEREGAERRQGKLLVVIVLLFTGMLSALILFGAYAMHPGLGVVIEAVMTYQILAARCLQVESSKVWKQLNAGSLEEARKAVSMIVGRDTEHLTEEGVAKAAIETVAENTSDGVIAPMLYTALGGPVLGFLYKAVNTMDSMVGYKNEKYLHFGRAAAKLDDVMNFFPARISALLMVGTAFISGKSYNGKQAWRIWRRDNRKHASPNSAQTESVCAGALGIQLAGDASYFGKVVKKPYIGDPTRAVEPEDIRRTNRLMNRTAWICEILCLGILIAVAV